MFPFLAVVVWRTPFVSYIAYKDKTIPQAHRLHALHFYTFLYEKKNRF